MTLLSLCAAECSEAPALVLTHYSSEPFVWCCTAATFHYIVRTVVCPQRSATQQRWSIACSNIGRAPVRSAHVYVTCIRIGIDAKSYNEVTQSDRNQSAFYQRSVAATIQHTQLYNGSSITSTCKHILCSRSRSIRPPISLRDFGCMFVCVVFGKSRFASICCNSNLIRYAQNTACSAFLQYSTVTSVNP